MDFATMVMARCPMTRDQDATFANPMSVPSIRTNPALRLELARLCEPGSMDFATMVMDAARWHRTRTTKGLLCKSGYEENGVCLARPHIRWKW